MLEILSALDGSMSKVDFDQLMFAHQDWENERDQMSDDLLASYDELGAMARNEAFDLLLFETKERTYSLIDTYFE